MAEPTNRSSPGSLPVVETFHSLQGEGFHAGRSAFFIRLGGCQVGCSWCDTKHSWPAGAHPQTSIAELVDQALAAARAGAGFVVITGGEPLHHNLDALCTALHPLTLHLETSGVDPLSGRFDWITLSPKPHLPPTEDALGRCDELKVVVQGPADLPFAERMATAAIEARQRGFAQPTAAPPVLLLQPGWECPMGLDLAVSFVREQPGWRLSLQTHKWLGVR